MTPELRSYFDEQMDQVMADMPERVHQLLDEVPLIVEDYPSDEVLRKMRVRRRDALCGLYTGIPLTDRSVWHSGVLSDVVHIYREGILRLARHRGHYNDEELRRQIRITILHELGHHHGLDEDDLSELGYG